MPAMTDWFRSTPLSWHAALALEDAGEVLERQRERIGPEPRDPRHLGRVADDIHGELLLRARLGQVEPGAVVQHTRSAIGPFPGRTSAGRLLLSPPQPPGPRQVDHQVDALRRDVQELPVPLHVVDQQPHQRRDRRVIRLQRTDRGDVRPHESPPDGALPQEPRQRLNLRQLRHHPIVPTPRDIGKVLSSPITGLSGWGLGNHPWNRLAGYRYRRWQQSREALMGFVKTLVKGAVVAKLVQVAQRELSKPENQRKAKERSRRSSSAGTRASLTGRTALRRTGCGLEGVGGGELVAGSPSAATRLIGVLGHQAGQWRSTATLSCSSKRSNSMPAAISAVMISARPWFHSWVTLC